jgi:hypothetical protein
MAISNAFSWLLVAIRTITAIITPHEMKSSNFIRRDTDE